MTDPTPSSSSSPEISSERSNDSSPAGRSGTGAWRILSILCAVSAILLIVLWTVQSRQASDLAAGSPALETSTISVVVDRLTPPPDASLVALGLLAAPDVPLAEGVAAVDVPASIHSLIAMVDGNRGLHGLAIARPNPAGGQVLISPRSTGEALLMLSPGILNNDVEGTVRSIESLSEDPAFVELESALLISSDLSEANPAVEAALAAILDRVPVRRPLPDQGCDSIVNQRAYTAAGTCIDPTPTGALISNEQDRWGLIFSGPEPYEQVCAALMPANTSGSRITLEPTTCGTTALLTAPGPTSSDSEQRFVQSRVRDAAAVQLYIDFVAPWADLAGGAAGLSTLAPTQLVADPDRVVSAVESMRTSNSAVVDALNVTLEPSTPIERHGATLVMARVMLSGQYAEQVAAHPLGDSPVAGGLLNFYDRVGAEMDETVRRELKWTASPFGLISIGADA